MPPTLVWFRNDLRLRDNPALHHAVSLGKPILPIFIWSEDEEKWPLGTHSRWWLYHSLKNLQTELDSINLKLIIRKGKSLEQIEKLIVETKSDALFFNRHFEPWILKRDQELKTALSKKAILVKNFNSSLLFEPGTICNKAGKPFQVFTFFWKACLEYPSPDTPIPPPRDPIPFLEKVKSDSLERPDFDLPWKPGEQAALQLLKKFNSTKLNTYLVDRDYPGLEGTSRLSPYLHFGEISPRYIWHAINDHPDAEGFKRQLGWREFAHQLLFFFPNTFEHPLKKEFVHFPWKKSPSLLNHWKEGTTGYPIVDAGMRQLVQTGWMHNRLRMIVGSFLVKDLMIPWQEGAKWFWEKLVDADAANNTLGWQWVAGCGADAAPYFRIFNPITQGEKFDPEGDFIKTWVPELKALPKAWIHKPWKAPTELLKNIHYSSPIVNHDDARKYALQVFKNLRTRD